MYPFIRECLIIEYPVHTLGCLKHETSYQQLGGFYYNGVTRRASVRRRLPCEEVSALFARLDVNGDGEISMQEWRLGYAVGAVRVELV